MNLPAPAAGTPVAEDWRAGGFGVYVHWPFCLSKCPYCDFNSHVAGAMDQERWRRALLAELAETAREVPGRRVDSVFFGGGTPSLMPAETVAAVIDAIAGHWQLPADAEVTLEANPGAVDAARFRGFRQAGVNRISIGIQSLDDESLRRLGRLHSAAEARGALDLARAIFPRVSFDLIYARQYQDPAQWRAELAEALALGPDHLSLYQLTIEPGTAFAARHARGRLPGLPDADTAALMFEQTQEICARAGLPAYEISNHARPGSECRHNLVYWRLGDYAGIGPGAHGRLTRGGTRLATANLRAPEAWLAAVETRGNGREGVQALSGAEQATECLLMGLRLTEGVALARLARLGAAPDPGRLAMLAGEGLIWTRAGRIGVTPAGRLVLDAVIAALAP